MKVICIDISLPLHEECPLRISEGEIYNVIGTISLYGRNWHELNECHGWVHLASAFIPLSEIDETEYATKELINLPYQIQEI